MSKRAIPVAKAAFRHLRRYYAAVTSRFASSRRKTCFSIKLERITQTKMAEEGGWEAESFEPEEPTKEAAVLDKWDGEDEQEDVKDNWDDDEEERKEGCEEKKAVKSEKKKLSEKIKEKEMLQKQEELLEKMSESQDSSELTPEEESEENLQKDSGPKPKNEALGVSNNVSGIDAISPSSKDDFTEFEKLLKEKLLPFEGSTHYSGFLESLFRDLCLSVEVEDLKKINASITVLLSEKQKQEKQQTKGKKKKKGVVPAGGLKAKMKDDLADYGGFDGGYTQDYEDFM